MNLNLYLNLSLNINNNSNVHLTSTTLEESESESRDEIDMQKEFEKMDKESRVAKRAFEQRIQKHKLIQVCTYVTISRVCIFFYYFLNFFLLFIFS